MLRPERGQTSVHHRPRFRRLLVPHNPLARFLLRPFVVVPQVPRFQLVARDFRPHRAPHRLAISDLLVYGQDLQPTHAARWGWVRDTRFIDQRRDVTLVAVNTRVGRY